MPKPRARARGRDVGGMKYAILSDIHGNLEALTAVLADVDARHPDAVFCLGDFVGYGPDPNACVARLRPILAGAVAGNHDLAALGDLDISVFNPLAQAAILWTREQMTPETRAFLRSLPERIERDGFVAVHGSMRDPIEEYIFEASTAEESFRAGAFHVCAVGHTHVPAVFTHQSDGVRAGVLAPEHLLHLDPATRYILNVGSVGQPRDGDPRAAYVWLEDDTARLLRIDYPLARTQEKMIAAGLPPALAERLAYGR
ncbi:MAG TPA: metallophosphoesterase family protein [bacterium]|jgi:predicted phosphodiesterase